MTDFFIFLIKSSLDTDLNGERKNRNLFLFTVFLLSKLTATSKRTNMAKKLNPGY